MELVTELEILQNQSLRRITGINRMTLNWIRTEDGGENIGTKYSDCVMQRGIDLDVTLAYSTEFNGAAERFNRTILDMARTMKLGMKT